MKVLLFYQIDPIRYLEEPKLGKLTENLCQHTIWRLYFAGLNFCEFRDFGIFRKIISTKLLKAAISEILNPRNIHVTAIRQHFCIEIYSFVC